MTPARAWTARLALACASAAAACSDGPSLQPDAIAGDPDAPPDAWIDPYPWELPPGFPIPLVPADDPMSPAKVELGRRLFYDARLSGNRTQSCASCHDPARAFTEPRATSIGSTGQPHPRNSMSLTNVAYLGRFTWANPLLGELEQQAVVPMFGTDPVELGMANREDELIERLAGEPVYPPLFAQAFDGPEPLTVANVVRAIAAFERTLISARSPYDRWQRGEAGAMSDAALRGYALFHSERLECFHCHQGFNFQDVVKYVGRPTAEPRFHNTALYNLGGTGAYPVPNTGIHEVTRRPEDMGRFRAPTLRNIAVTAPYFHDGSAATLDDVIDHYAAGGRTIESGPYAGVGAANPFKSSFLIGFVLTPEERADLRAFLEALTDESFLSDPRFADPWTTP